MTPLHSPEQAARWLRQRVTGVLHVDSRQVKPGDGFIAWPGAATDGRQYVGAALAQGARACLVEQEGADAFGFTHEAVASYPQLKAATGLIADAYYESPSRALQVLAITGTNGKTSSAWWLAAALSKLELPALSPSALAGTLGIGVPPNLLFTGLTTPDPVLLQRCFRDFVTQGVKSCVIEASSIGLVEHRLAGTQIRVGVFTNFTQDHLDYHQTMQAYWEAKAALFEWPSLQAAVINVDDPRGAELAGRARQRGLDVWTVSLGQHEARLSSADLRYGARGLQLTVEEGDARQALDTGLIGDYNAANLLGVLGALRALGVSLADAVRVCEHLPPVPGRMEQIAVDHAPLAVIDYAHTPDALEKALAALRPLAARCGGQLWCVFGCGGNRDAAKRPLMGAAAERGADRLLITSDNPRGEAPSAIMAAIRAGLERPEAAAMESDRARAIAQALEQAGVNDVVLIAGKGHEDYQEVRGERRPFSDQAHARAAVSARASVAGVVA